MEDGIQQLRVAFTSLRASQTDSGDQMEQLQVAFAHLRTSQTDSNYVVVAPVAVAEPSTDSVAAVVETIEDQAP